MSQLEPKGVHEPWQEPFGRFFAGVASLLDEAGIDHVLWGYTAWRMHGVDTSGVRNESCFKFVVPDDKIGQAAVALHSDGAEFCRGGRDCRVLFPRQPVGWDHWPMPAQHVHYWDRHYPQADEPEVICFYKHSKVLPMLDSLKETTQPRPSASGSEWGVVSADTYASNFFHYIEDESKLPSLKPLRVLPPHRQWEAYIRQMLRERYYSFEEVGWWTDLSRMSGLYRMLRQEKVLAGWKPPLLDPAIMPAHMAIYLLKMSHNEVVFLRTDYEDDLRYAEGMPRHTSDGTLLDRLLGTYFPPPAQLSEGGDSDKEE